MCRKWCKGVYRGFSGLLQRSKHRYTTAVSQLQRTADVVRKQQQVSKNGLCGQQQDQEKQTAKEAWAELISNPCAVV